MSELTDIQLAYIGKKLDRMIGKKEHPNDLRDYKKAAVLFYDLVNMNYQLTNDDIEKAIELSNTDFSDDMINDMGHIANAMYYLKLGLDDEFRNDYGITTRELNKTDDE